MASTIVTFFTDHSQPLSARVRLIQTTHGPQIILHIDDQLLVQSHVELHLSIPQVEQLDELLRTALIEAQERQQDIEQLETYKSILLVSCS